jgi:polyisoprenoid-binding protein YceI
MIRFLLAAFALLLAPNAHATDWLINSQKSTIAFEGSLAGEKFVGQFKRFDAQIHFDPAKLDEAAIVITIDMASARIGDAQKDAALPKREWFDVKSHATARWASRGVRLIEKDRYAAAGVLAMKGATKPVPVSFALKIKNGKARAVGSALIDRSEFGVGSGSFATDEWVAFPVKVMFDIEAQKAPENKASTHTRFQ